MKWMPEQISIVSEDVEIYHSLPTLNGITFIQERSVTGIKLSDEVAKAKPMFKYRRKRALIQAEAIKFKQMDFVSLLKLAIAPYLSGGKLPIKLAAEILRINVRTLQRRLEKEGVIYKELVDDMTFEIIEKELLSSKETITFIASKYGYSDAAHFTRAFKRRYNITPGNFRNKTDSYIFYNLQFNFSVFSFCVSSNGNLIILLFYKIFPKLLRLSNCFHWFRFCY
ncbi:transcriptional regulator [Vibrio ishigakensis]|uniref:Transcriptional regulator n=1 Tax=Vibrio ishigakensis TaxID=1481914 RepID=A0A0B8PKI6_9VIBR|nr:transcriptional regulator [Vibrio ishigakensis]